MDVNGTTRLEPALADVRLSGRIALVTGAGLGLGQAIAVSLARAGAALAVTARDTAALTATVRQLDELGVTSLAVTLEVRDRDSIRAAVEAIEGRLGPVDILVNNAGVQRLRPAFEVSEDDWTYVLDTNLRGTFFCCQEVGKRMMTRRRGRIVDVSSAAGVLPVADRVAYASSKAGVNMLTRVLALEWAAFGITVNAIAPTIVETQLGRQTLADPDVRAYWTDRIPLGRVALPEDALERVGNADNVFPLEIVAASPDTDVHRVRPHLDDDINWDVLPSGWIEFDTIRIDYPLAEPA